MQFITALLSEICCLYYIASINRTLDVIIKFMAISKISKVGELYSNSMPSENKIKTKSKKKKSAKLENKKEEKNKAVEENEISFIR